MTTIRSTTAAMLLGLLAACGGGASDASSTGDSAAGAMDATTSEGNPGERPVHARVVVTGGQYAGTYDATVESSACTGSPTETSMGIMMTPDSVPTTRSIQQLTFATEDLKGSRGGTSNFGLTMRVGDANGARELRIDPARGAGSGSATVSGDWPIFSARVQGKSADGASVDATFDCAKEK